MSFEGSFEFIAEDGSYWQCDVYQEIWFSPDTGSPAKWMHLIDETNGIDERDESTVPARKRQIGSLKRAHPDPLADGFMLDVPIFEPESSAWNPVKRKVFAA